MWPQTLMLGSDYIIAARFVLDKFPASRQNTTLGKTNRVLTPNGAIPPAGALRPSTPQPSSEGAFFKGCKPEGDSRGSYVSVVTS